tara:strand:+ start:505 stop:714 length:210 start_codon:yes stop_codon:yes gene_type:complete
MQHKSKKTGIKILLEQQSKIDPPRGTCRWSDLYKADQIATKNKFVWKYGMEIGRSSGGTNPPCVDRLLD